MKNFTKKLDTLSTAQEDGYTAVLSRLNEFNHHKYPREQVAQLKAIVLRRRRNITNYTEEVMTDFGNIRRSVDVKLKDMRGMAKERCALKRKVSKLERKLKTAKADMEAELSFESSMCEEPFPAVPPVIITTPPPEDSNTPPEPSTTPPKATTEKDSSSESD